MKNSFLTKTNIADQKQNSGVGNEVVSDAPVHLGRYKSAALVCSETEYLHRTKLQPKPGRILAVRVVRSIGSRHSVLIFSTRLVIYFFSLDEFSCFRQYCVSFKEAHSWGDEIGFTSTEHTNDWVPDAGRLERGRCAEPCDPLRNLTIV